MAMRRSGFTLIEMIITLVISAILSVGTMIALKGIYEKTVRTKHLSLLSLDSQIIADRVSTMLYDRIPSTALGYDPVGNSILSIYNITPTDSMSIFEWYGEAIDLKNSGNYSGFIDMDASNEPTNTINSPVWNIANPSNLALIFAGSYDMGEDIVGNFANFANLFGWHGNATKSSLFTINTTTGDNLTLNQKPIKIYEKYYLVDQAYAIARGADLNQAIFSANCINDLDYPTVVDNFQNSLFIFYNYRPWLGDTFCADPNNNGARRGRVALLSENVSAFNLLVTPTMELKFSITMEGLVRGSDRNVTVSKQKIIL